MLDELRQNRTEYFAKGLEKFTFLSTLLGKFVKNLDDYGCPKIQRLNTDWLALTIPTDTKSIYTGLSGKNSIWSMDCATFQFVNLLYVFVFLIHIILKFFVQLKFFPLEIHSYRYTLT